jgi:hypothetical protein
MSRLAASPAGAGHLEKALGPSIPDVAIAGELRCFIASDPPRCRSSTTLRRDGSISAHGLAGYTDEASTDPPGVFVEQVIAESPAAHAGIQVYDVVIRFTLRQPDPRRCFPGGATAIGASVDVDIIHEGRDARYQHPEQRPPFKTGGLLPAYLYRLRLKVGKNCLTV